ncbi:MAG: hypothetical protein K2L00_10365 [Muribaculaceae bacterium]|nr:hypothetical protein [Muribaculaceae bacterium]
MTLEQLQKANDLQKGIEDAKEFLAVLSDTCDTVTLSGSAELDNVTVGNGPFRDLLKEKVQDIIESMERDFNWL